MDRQTGTRELLFGVILLAACLFCEFSAIAADSTATGTAGTSAKPLAVQAHRQARRSAKAVAASARRQGTQPGAAASKAAEVSPASSTDEIALMKQQLSRQQQQIERLSMALAEQKQLLERAIQSVQSTATAQVNSSQPAGTDQVASLAPVVPMAPNAALASSVAASSASASYSGFSTGSAPGRAPASEDDVQGYTKKVDTMTKTVDALNKGLAGFRFGGDFRLRSDNILRSGNSIAGPQQNVRARYRLRVNIDKKLSDQADFHMTLGSGLFNNTLTYDTDFTGLTSRGAIFLTDAYAAYHPNSTLDLRGGKMAEVFRDDEKFLIDDDVRLNGFQEVIKTPFNTSALGKVTFQLLAGQYILTNPNVQVLGVTAASCAASAPPAACGWLAAGFTPGKKVPATDLFDQGFSVAASPSETWTHTFTGNVQLWRNPNSVQLGSVASGVGLVVNPLYGLALSSPLTNGLGNGTTTAGGAKYTANNFQVGRIAYRVDYKGFKSNRQGFPLYLDLQAARNFGSSFYNNAAMGTINFGETKKFGDVLFRYGYFYKQANSMISQITDDDAGTGTGVNLRTHMVRIDLGMNKFMVWQNYLYVQNELAGNDPARHFFVPLQRGAATQYRFQTQMLFNF